MWLNPGETEEIRLSREELYNLVWSTPLSRLAHDFVISDVALAKWCKKLNVPRPGVGYWAKFQAGHKVPQKKLPKPGKDTSTAIYIRKIVHPPEGEPVVQEPVFEPISVPNALPSKPHELVRFTRKVLNKARVDHGYVQNDHGGCSCLFVSRKSLKRALCLLEALFLAAEAAGWVVHAESRAVIEVEGTKVPIHIEELRSQSNRRDPNSYRDDDYLYLPDGRLRLELAEKVPMKYGIRRTWNDGKVQRLENVLHQVCLGIWRCAQAIRAWEERQAAWERQRREDERQRQLARERELLENRRHEDLDARLVLWTKAGQIRDLVAALRTPRQAGEVAEGLHEGGELGLGDHKAWVAWLEEQASICVERALNMEPFKARREERWPQR